MLAPYRVLDCTDGRGQLAGLMLAQLGAEVMLVEPPGGTPSRRGRRSSAAPRSPDRPVALGLQPGEAIGGDRRHRPGGRRELDRPPPADVLLWSGRPAECPFDLDELTSQHPHLVVVALTPFGLDGPKAGWRDSDLIVSASSCQLILTGDTDRPPLRMGSPRRTSTARRRRRRGADGADRAPPLRPRPARRRLRAGLLHAGVVRLLDQRGVERPAHGPGRRRHQPGQLEAALDLPGQGRRGHDHASFGTAMAPFMANLFQWIWEEGGCDEATRDKPWADLWCRSSRRGVPHRDRPPRRRDRRVHRSRTKAELVAEAAAGGCCWPPSPRSARCSTTTTSPPGASGTTSRSPRPDRPAASPAASSSPPARRCTPSARRPSSAPTARPCWPSPSGRPAPAARPKAGTTDAAAARRAEGDRPHLVGRRALVGRNLADFGATVVRVESSRRRPGPRGVAVPPAQRQHPLEGSGMHAYCNASKLGLELDLATGGPRGVLGPGALGRRPRRELLGGRARADGVRLREAGGGQPGADPALQLPAGPDRHARAARLRQPQHRAVRVHDTTRWPGRPAAGPFGAYTDVVSPRFGLAAVLAALDHRRRTGLGQHLDLSQAEASLHFLSPALLDAELNGTEFAAPATPTSTRAPRRLPGGGRRPLDRPGLHRRRPGAPGRLLGRDDLAGLDADPAPGPARRARRAGGGVHRAGRDGEAEAELQALGVAAHQVQNSHECLRDPQLAHRGHYVTVEHPYSGRWWSRAPASGSPGRPGVAGPAPTYGQHATRCCTASSATTTTASPSSPPPARWAESSPGSRWSTSACPAATARSLYGGRRGRRLGCRGPAPRRRSS